MNKKYLFSWHKKFCILPVILIMIWSHSAKALMMQGDSLRFEVLMSQSMLSDTLTNEKFIQSLEITSNRILLLATDQQFYLLGWGDILPLGQKFEHPIGSFAYTPDSVLMAIQKDELCMMDSAGRLSKLFKLPAEGMGISAGKYVMFIFDKKEEQPNHSLYVIAKGGKYKKLFDTPSAIQSVVEMNNSILVSTKNILFRLNPQNNEIKILSVLPKDQKIRSIAVDTLSNLIFFSSEKEIYALKDSNVVTISTELGGILKHFGDGLLVFNADKKLLIRMIGLDKTIASKVQEMKTVSPDMKQEDILTNETIIDLVESKLPDEVIINLINRSQVNFNVSVDAMIYLSSQNVSSEVIMAMKNAMKKKNQ